MRACIFLGLFLSGVLPQSLEYVYWTPVVGQPQVDTTQALAIVNGTDVTVFKPSSAPGVVNSMYYQSGTQFILAYPFVSGVALPAGAAQANVPADVAGMPYQAYAFGGSVTGPTGLVSYSSGWLGWTGSAWVPIATSGTAPAPRVNAGAVFLKKCDTAGNPCILLVGGQTPGTPMAASGLGVMTLTSLTSATPVFKAQATFPGAEFASAGVGVDASWAPPGRHSMALSASPDGTTAFIFGGMLDGGAVTNDFFALSLLGWTNDQDVVPAELFQVVSYNGSPGNPAAGVPANPASTAKHYPCNPNLVSPRCPTSYLQGRSCFSTRNDHNGKGFGTPDYYNLATNAQGRVSIQQCDSWGSAYVYGSAYNAIDGNTDGNFVAGSVTRTNSDNSLFVWAGTTGWVPGQPPVQLRVDLQFTRSSIQQVHVYWRTDCCLSRSGGFEVWVGNNAGPDLAANTKLYNPYSDAVNNPTVLSASDLSGRYVFVTLPGQQRVLGVAEVRVWVRRPNTWRKLNGLVNVAQGAAVQQSSAAPAFLNSLRGDPTYAVDGQRTTTSMTNFNIPAGNKLAGQQYLLLDLGAEYAVLSLAIQSGSGIAGGGAAAGAGLMVSMGVTQDLAQARACTGAPGLATGVGAFLTAPVTIATCSGSARYVHVWKVAGTSGWANSINVAELVVNAEKMRFLPEARRGAGYAVYGKYLVIHGGYRADYTACADVRFFDMTTYSWLPTPLSGLLGNPPPARAYGALVTLPATYLGVRPTVNQLIVFGGETSVGQYNDLFVLNLPACPAPVLTGVATWQCGTGATTCAYTCAANFKASNAPLRVSCQVNGFWDGVTPLCVPAASQLPSAPAAPIVNPGPSDGSVLVSFSASSVTGGPFTGFLVSPLTSDVFDNFAAGVGSLAAGGYTWYNGDLDPNDQATNTYLFTGGALQIQSYVYDNTQAGAANYGECKYGHQMCPFFLRSFPASLPGLSAGGSFVLESRVSMTPQGKVYPISEQLIGISVYDSAQQDPGTFCCSNPYTIGQNTVKRRGAFQVFAGLRVFGAGCQFRQTCNDNQQRILVGMKGFNSAAPYSWWVDTAESFPTPGMVITSGAPVAYYTQAYIRLERDAANGRWRVGYKFQAEQTWLFSPYVSDAALLWGGTLKPASTLVGPMASNSNTFNRGLGSVYYMRIAALADVAAGFPVNVSSDATPALITGLTPGATYGFTVQASSVLGLGAAAPVTGYTVPAATTVVRYPPAFLVAARPTSAFSSPLASGTAALGIDGSAGTLFATTGAEPRGDWWAADLGITSAVKEVSITNAPSGANRLINFRVLVGNVLDWKVASLCSSAAGNVPAVIALGATQRFPCSGTTGLTGRYIFVQALAAATPVLSFAELSVFVNNSCPARPTPAGATQLTGTQCGQGAPYGAVCVQTCNNGWAAVSGTSASTCNGDAWNDPPLVCKVLCGTRGVPNLASACVQSLYTSRFSTGLPDVWADLRAAPPALGPYLSVSLGALQASARPSAGSELHAVALSSTVQQWRQAFTWTGVMTPGADRLGLVWRIQDQANFYRAVIDPSLGIHSIERMKGGVLSTLTSAPLPISPGAPFTLSVATPFYNLNLFNVTINNVPLMATTDTSFAVGYTGLYAATSAVFSSAVFTVDCEGSGCSGLTGGNTCRYTCGPGLTKGGPDFYSCTDTGAWNGDSVNGTFCTLDPPLFTPATLLMPENAPVKTLVGSPLQASLKSPDFQLSYSIVQQFRRDRNNAANSTLLPQSAWPFAVDSCSGQVSVLSQACSGGPFCELFDFENPNFSVFVLMVRVSTNGPAAFTQQNVTIQLTNMVEPPFCAGAGGGATAPTAGAVQTLTLRENPALLGAVFGTITASSGDASVPLSAVSYSLVVDTTGGYFRVNATTGNVTALPPVACGGGPTCFFNYEAPLARDFALTVRVTVSPPSAYDPDGSLFGNCGVAIALRDANDPPSLQLASGATLFTTITQTAAEVGATIPTPALPLVLGELVSGGAGVLDEDYLPSPTSSGAFTAAPLSITYFKPADSPDNYAAYCGTPAPPLEYPTLTGLRTGASNQQLFEVVSGTTTNSSGTLKLIRRPARGSAAGGWQDNVAFPPFLYNGLLLRKAWALCLAVDDRVNPITYGVLQVLMIADIPNLPLITSFDTTTLPTLGGGLVNIYGTSLGNFSSSYRANASLTCAAGNPLFVSGSLPPFCTAPFRPTSATLPAQLTMACSIVVNDTQLACVTPIGQGANLNFQLTVNLRGQQFVPAAAMVPSVFSYAAPLVTSVTGNTGWPTAGTQNAVFTLQGANFGIQYRTGTGAPNNCRPNGVSICAPTVTWSSSLVPGGPPAYTMSCTLVPGLRLSQYNALNYAALDSRVVCNQTAGAGANMPWTLTVGGQSFTATDPATFISYAPPTLTSVTWGVGVNSQSLNTLGGQTFRVTGAGFGPAASPIAVFIGNWAANCTSHIENRIDCRTGGGTGINAQLSVLAGGQASANTLGPFSYRPIVLTSVTGPGASQASTEGGEVVYLGGTGFGPLGLVPASVQYGNKGPTGNLYTATLCRVTSSDVQITCLTAPGVGSGHAWLINGGYGSTSNRGVLFPANTGYAAPTVYSFLPTPAAPSADTAGVPGDLLLVTGRNFGPVDAYTNSLLSISLGTTLALPLLAAPTLASTSFATKTLAAPGWQGNTAYALNAMVTATDGGRYLCVGAGVSGDPGAGALGPLGGSGVPGVQVDGTAQWAYAGGVGTDTGCAIQPYTFLQALTGGAAENSTNSSAFTNSSSLPQSVIACTLPKGAGSNLQWTITVDGQSSAGPTTSYAPPVITAIVDWAGAPVLNLAGNGANTTGGDTVTIVGRFFGPTSYGGRPLIQNVSFGPVTLTEYPVPPSQWTLLDDTRLQVRLPSGYGIGNRFLISVADQAAPIVGAPTFDYRMPIVTAISPNLVGTYLPSFASLPTIITVRVINLNLSPAGLVGAKIGITLGDTRLNPSDPGSPYAVQLTPILPTTPAAIAAATNADGSVTISFVAPSGAGVGRAVRVYLCARSTVTGDCFSDGGSTLAPGTLLSYMPPTLYTAVTSSLLTAPLSATDAAACSACAATFLTCAPARALLATLGSNWVCPDAPLSANPADFYAQQVTITGLNLGNEVARDPIQGTQVPATPSSVTDGGVKRLYILASNASGVGPVWTDVSAQVYSWTDGSPSTIIALMPYIASSTLMVEISSTDALGVVHAQTAMLPFGAPTPTVLAVANPSSTLSFPPTPFSPLPTAGTGTGQYLDLYASGLSWALAPPPTPAYYRVFATFGNPDATPRTRSTGTSPLQLDLGFPTLLAGDGVTVVNKLRLLLPLGGAGAGIGLQLSVYSVGAQSPVLVAQNVSVNWPVSSYSYAPPYIPDNSVLVRNASWGGPGDPPCPWASTPSSNPDLFSCTASPLYQLTINGLNFGPAASPSTNRVWQDVRFSTNGTFDPTTILVSNWSDTRLTAYSPYSYGSISVCLGATDYFGAAFGATENVTFDARVCGRGDINVSQCSILAMQYVTCPAVGTAGGCAATGLEYRGPFSTSGLAGIEGAAVAPGPYWVSLDISNVNPTDALEVGLQVFTGSSNITEAFVLQPARVRFPADGSAAAPGDASYAASMASLLSSSALSGKTLRSLTLQVPPGQGTGIVYVRRTLLSSSASVTSLSSYSIPYSFPVLSTAQVSVGGALQSTTIIRSPFNTPRVRVPTDTLAGGGTRLTLNGTNLGIFPVVNLGDGWACGVARWRSSAPPYSFACTFGGGSAGDVFLSTLTDCSATSSGAGAGTYSCWSFTPPRGEGSGPPPTGFTLSLSAGASATTPTPFGYTLPTVTAVTSATGRFPTLGGPLLTFTGTNFGFSRADKAGTTAYSVRTFSPQLPSTLAGNMQELCAAPITRQSDTSLTCTLLPGGGAGLTVRLNILGAPALPLLPSATLALNDADTPLAFSYDLPYFSAAASAINITGMGAYAEAQPRSVSAYPLLRSGTQGGAIITLQGGNFGTRPSWDPTPVCAVDPVCAACDVSTRGNYCPPSGVGFTAQGLCLPTPAADFACLNCTGEGVQGTWCDASGSTAGEVSQCFPPGTPPSNISDACSWFTGSRRATSNATCASALCGSTPPIALNPDKSNCPFNSACAATSPPLYCVFLLWANRPLGSPPPKCNGVEDFLGEGELPYSAVLSWSDSAITLVVPEGLGGKEVYVSVRGSGMALDPALPGTAPNTPLQRNSTQRLLFAYAPPIIYSNITPSLVNTDGSTLVTLYGANFGPPLYNTSAPGGPTNPYGFVPTVSLGQAPTLPTAYTAVIFSASCTTTTRSLYGTLIGSSSFVPWYGVSTDLRTCFNGLVSRTHNSLTFLAPPGIGRARNVQVITVDAPSDTPPASLVTFPSASNLIQASYVPPSFLPDGYTPPTTNPPVVVPAFAPATCSDCPINEIYLPGLNDAVLTISGKDFGDPSLAAAQGWSLADTLISVKVNGVPCGVTCDFSTQPPTCANSTHLSAPPGPTRSIVNGVNTIQCGIDPSTPVGFADVEVSVAGNAGLYRNDTALLWRAPYTNPPLLVCAGSSGFGDYGHYGRMNETCLPCPWPAGWLKPGARCTGFNYAAFGGGAAADMTAPIPGSFVTPDCTGNPPGPGTGSATCFRATVAPGSGGPVDTLLNCSAACAANVQCMGYTFFPPNSVPSYDPTWSAVQAAWGGRCYLRMGRSLPLVLGAGNRLSFTPFEAFAGSLCAYKPPFVSRSGPYAKPGGTLGGTSLAVLPDVWPILNSLMAYPIPLAGYFNLNGSMAGACPAGFGVPGRDVCIVPCQPTYACLEANVCELGYASAAPMYRCSSCALGYFRSGGSCIKCPDSPYTTLVLVVVLVLALAGVGFWLNKHQVNLAVLSIGVDYFQVLAILSSAPIRWPLILQQLWRFMAAFNLNIEIVAPECLVPNVTFTTKWLIVMALPLGLMCVLGAQFAWLYLFKRLCKGHTVKRKLLSHYPTLISSWLILMYLFYLYMTKSVLDIFNCIPTAPPDGNLYLSATFERCTTPMTGVQAALLAPALAGLGFYTLGFPLFVASNLYKRRSLVMEDQLLRAKGTGGDALTNPNAFIVRRTFGRTYFTFKPEWYLWILAILLRKMAIAAASVIFSASPSFQMAACLLVMFLAFSAQVQVRPYLCAAEFEGVLAHNTQQALLMPKSIYAQLQKRLAGVASMQKKAARPNALMVKGRPNPTALAHAIATWLINYNTIEAIMLFSGVAVCLLFLLYISTLPDANGLSPYADSQSYIVNLLLTTVILSCIYYFSVVIFEITTLVAESRRMRVHKLSSGPAKGMSSDERLRAGNRLHEDELTAGGADLSLNPMLIKGGQLNMGARKAGERPGLTEEVRLYADGFIAHDARLPSELWPAFQATFAALNTANGAVAGAIAASKKRIQETRMGVGKRGAGGGAAGGGAEAGEAGEAAAPGVVEEVGEAAAGAPAPAALKGSVAAGEEGKE